MHRRRATQNVSRRTYVPAHHAKRSSLLHVHRAVFIVVLTYDVWEALWFVDPATGKTSFGIGVGTLVLAVNVYLLGGYTFGCHSLRHLVGGFLDQLSESRICNRAYTC